MVQQRRRPVPHRTSTHIEGTQSPACNPLAIPEYSPRRPQRCSPTVADRPVPPDPVPILPTPNHLARGALFPFAYEVSCRVRAERVKPYASSRELAIHPADLVRSVWVPRPPAPPGS
jgi:hypothetical protein